MIHVRHGGPSSGYISAGFFGGKFLMCCDVQTIGFQPHLGLTAGRVALLWVNAKVT
jgi:hypothetical protein